MSNKNIGRGIDDFKEIIEKDYYFVDKSLFIKDIIDDASKVKLITRPRRFGKTLNMSMLKYFFDVVGAEENKKLFNGLKIKTVDNGEYIKYQGGNPVVYLSLKGIDATNSETMKKSIRDYLKLIVFEHSYVKENISDFLRNEVDEYLNDNNKDFSRVLKFLCQILNEYYGKKAILLIDEYDAPLLSAYSKSFYDDIIDFFKAFYTDALKGNEFIETAVMTGVTRVAKESIFSGLNHLGVYTILSNYYKEYFGFNENEVMEILEYYDLGDNMAGVQDYYDGYHFGNHIQNVDIEKTVQVIDMYNPWSIINFAKEKILQSFWINTSGDTLIKDIAKKDFVNFIELCTPLIDGDSIEIVVDEFITLQNIGRMGDIWTLLLHSGYLTVDNFIHTNRYKVKLPNKEVRTYFLELFDTLISSGSKYDRNINILSELYKNFDKFIDIINNRTLSCASYHDLSEEQHYHNLLLGALSVNAYNEYEVKSNRESGLGRPDIIVTKRGKAPEFDETYVFEVKYAKEENEKEGKLKEARNQILNKKYADTIKGKIHLVAVVAFDKSYTFEIF